MQKKQRFLSGFPPDHRDDVSYEQVGDVAAERPEPLEMTPDARRILAVATKSFSVV